MRAIDGDRLIDSLESAKEGRGIGVDLVYSLIQEGIRQLPTLSVDDLRPNGYWIGVEADEYADGLPVYNLWQCSECGEEVEDEDVSDTHPFCHCCGAYMRGG